MTSQETSGGTHTRRRVLAGVGGIGMLSLSGVPIMGATPAQVADLEVDPYTRDTFRAIIDALVPETPGLASELGPEHVPGGLEVSLEDFLLYGLNNFQEIHSEMLTGGGLSFDEGVIVKALDEVVNGLATSKRRVLRWRDVEYAGAVFGDFGEMTVEIAGTGADTGAVQVDFTVEAGGTSVSRRTTNLPYSELFAIVFELVAIEYVARDNNREDYRPRSQFAAGGVFTQLSRRDRLRVLESIIDGSLLAALDDTVGRILPTIGVAKFGVMAVHGLTYIGYYSEWAGYGDTRTDSPNDRELQVPPGEVLGHRQAGFPGLERGYAAHRGFEVNSFRENEWEDHFEDDDGSSGGGDDGNSGWWW